jgi:ubiquinone/menaquinone biosynthesis C-methylase UbiE/DNA-binding transcriptional ArsR family regulator
VPSLLKSLKLLSDPARLRVLLLLEREELSVAELQEILGMGQSRISTYLAQLRSAGLVEDRRQGKNSIYRLKSREFVDLLSGISSEIVEAEEDEKALHLILERRRDHTRQYFDQLAGKFGRDYIPGRSWKALAEALLQLMPPMTIADLGAGEGTFSQLLAQRAVRVIAVDNSAKMVEYGARLARENKISNLEYRLGDLEQPPIESGTIDLAFFSQSLHHAVHPDRAVQAAWGLLRPGGRIAVLDLKRHHFEQARELYADTWLGFSEPELRDFLTRAGFEDARTWVVDKEKGTPGFETVLAVAEKKA